MSSFLWVRGLTVPECALADTLYGLLQDKDALVVANCVAALEEVIRVCVCVCVRVCA
jgi:hypothetical protein